MKKLALALLCLVSVAFFASCDEKVEHPEPSIAILVEDGYVANNAFVNEMEEVYFGFVVASNPETQEALASLIVTVDDQPWDTVTFTNETEYTYKSGVIYTPAKDSIVRTSTITAIVTDAAGQSATATIDLSILYKEQPLVATDFAWNRHGAAAVTGGIEEYGLQWTSNGKEIFAELKPMDGATLYEFDPSVWSATTNEVQKATLFSELPLSIPVFKKVSAWASNNYDFVIGTTYQGKNYLIHITEGIVSTFKGTDIVIKGQAK